MDTEGLFLLDETDRTLYFFNLMHKAAASGNRERTATTGIELNQVEKHGANLWSFNREMQTNHPVFNF
jgi:hypothetical protein